MSSSSLNGRIAALIALVIAVLAVVVLMGNGGSSYEVTAEFENAGQLVKGNEVVVGGTAAGTVKEIQLGPEGEALVTFSVDDDYAPLRRGTIATVRSPSLSQIAGRQVQLTLPPDSSAGEEIADGDTLTQAETVSAVDLDQLFNTLSPKTIKDFKHVIQGFELSYEGVGPQANRGLKYLNPLLSTSRRVFSRAQLRPERVREPDRRQLEALRGARRPRPRHLGAGREPEPDDERDRRAQGAPRAGDLPVPRLHAQREHDLRQPQRGALGRSTRSSTPQSRSPKSFAPSSPSSAPRPPTRCHGDRPRRDHQKARRRQRPRRADRARAPRLPRRASEAALPTAAPAPPTPTT